MLGDEHPHTLVSVGNLGTVLSRQGKYEEAETMHRRALKEREKALGREHPHTLTSVYCLAHQLVKRRDYKQSLVLYNRACDGYSVVFESTTQLPGHVANTVAKCLRYKSSIRWSSPQVR